MRLLYGDLVDYAEYILFFGRGCGCGEEILYPTKHHHHHHHPHSIYHTTSSPHSFPHYLPFTFVFYTPI